VEGLEVSVDVEAEPLSEDVGDGEELDAPSPVDEVDFDDRLPLLEVPRTFFAHPEPL
jgi:hypothetical protein